jgi:predicted histone-like DNA-binding protein
MSIQFKLTPKKNPQNLDDPPKYYARAIVRGKRDLEQMSELVARHSALSEADVYGLLKALETETIQSLLDGFSVEMGELCIFYPQVQSEGIGNEEEFQSKQHIKRKTVGVRARSTLKYALERVETERVDNGNGKEDDADAVKKSDGAAAAKSK